MQVLKDVHLNNLTVLHNNKIPVTRVLDDPQAGLLTFLNRDGQHNLYYADGTKWNLIGLTANTLYSSTSSVRDTSGVFLLVNPALASSGNNLTVDTDKIIIGGTGTQIVRISFLFRAFIVSSSPMDYAHSYFILETLGNSSFIDRAILNLYTNPNVAPIASGNRLYYTFDKILTLNAGTEISWNLIIQSTNNLGNESYQLLNYSVEILS